MHAWWERFRKGLRKEKGGVASYNLQLYGKAVQAADAKGVRAQPQSDRHTVLNWDRTHTHAQREYIER